jgi:hypothetical protein
MTVVWVGAGIIIISVICLCFIFFKKTSSVSGSPKNQTVPKSKTPIDLSVFDKICKKEGVNGKVDFEPIPIDDNNTIKALIGEQKPLTPELLKRNPPVKIVYTDTKEDKTVRDIIPFRIVGSIDQDKDGTKEYDFYIEAYCLLRNQERSFHTNGISAAYYKGRENNLGDYLVALYRKPNTRRHKEDA